MATTKVMKGPPKTQKSVVNLIRYIINPLKTEQCLYVASANCAIPTAPDEFRYTRYAWGKNTGNYAYHLEQSFLPGEATPEEVRQCGIELMQALFGDAFQVVMGTHLDQDHLHNHFAVCAVSLKDGHKLQTDHDFIRKMREESDRICREHGLSVVENPKSKGKTYAEWITEKNGGFTWRGKIREDIDAALSRAETFSELLDVLKAQGYSFKEGTHLAVSPPGNKNYFRLYKLGKGYSEEDLAARLHHVAKVDDSSLGIARHRKPYKTYRAKSSTLRHRYRGIQGMYYVYLYRFRKLLSPGKTKMRKSALAPQDAKKVNQLAYDLRLLRDHQIDSVIQLAEVDEQLAKSQTSLYKQRSSLRCLLRKETSTEQMEVIRQKIEAINQDIKHVRMDRASCERIYQRTCSYIKQENNEKKGMVDHGDRSRSNGYPVALNARRR